MRWSSHVFLRVRTAFVGIVAIVAGTATAFAAVEPLHVLPGSPLHGPTHLQLIVCGLPPLVLDVDQRTTRSVADVTGGPHDTAWVTPEGAGALAQVSAFRVVGGCAPSSCTSMERCGLFPLRAPSWLPHRHARAGR